MPKAIGVKGAGTSYVKSLLNPAAVAAEGANNSTEEIALPSIIITDLGKGKKKKKRKKEKKPHDADL